MVGGRCVTGVVVAVVAALLWIPASLGATPRQIGKDLADGRLDQTYSAADLHAYVQNAAVQGYPNEAQTPPNSATAGAESNNGQLGAQASQGVLPFTGVELGIFAAIGGALLASGLLLRSTARQKSRT